MHNGLPEQRGRAGVLPLRPLCSAATKGLLRRGGSSERFFGINQHELSVTFEHDRCSHGSLAYWDLGVKNAMKWSLSLSFAWL